MKKFTPCLVIAICLLAFTLSNCEARDKSPAPAQGVQQGQLATDFTLTDLNGKKVTLSSFRNKKAVVLSFWATWCPYCIREIPGLKNLHTKFNKRGLEILSINIAANDPPYRVTQYVKKKAIPYTVLYDKDGTLSRTYGVTGIPVSVIIDKKGKIVYRGYGMPGDAEQYFTKTLVKK